MSFFALVLLLITISAWAEPPHVRLTPIAPGGISILWEHPNDGAGSIILEREDPSFAWVFVALTNSFTDLGLQASRVYRYRVCAVYGQTPDCTPWMAAQTLAVPPPYSPPEVPSFTSISATDNSITVNWTSSASYSFHQVRWAQNGYGDEQNKVKGRLFTANGLRPGTTYHFIVQGCNRTLLGSSCSKFSAPIEIATSGQPPPPPQAAAPVPGTGPTVASYTVGDIQQLETLFVSPAGALGLVWKANNSHWEMPISLSPDNFLPPNAHISVVNYPVNNQLEAFYAGNDGAIYVSFKANNGPWSKPIRLTPPNTMHAGGDLSAVFYPPDNHLEVLFIGADGALNVLWKAQNGNWEPPAKISAPNLAPSGGGISAAFYPLDNHLEAVFAANDGGIRLAWKANNGAWKEPIGISPANITPAGAGIALQFYPPNNQLEAFFVDNAGQVNVLWKAQNGAWNQPVGIGPPQTGVPGKSVVASFYPPNNQLEVFTIAASGAVKLLWKAQNGPWAPPVSLTAEGVAQPGSKLGVKFQPLGNRLELFYTDTTGVLGLIFKAQNGNWSFPSSL